MRSPHSTFDAGNSPYRLQVSYPQQVPSNLLKAAIARLKTKRDRPSPLRSWQQANRSTST